jgi:hypothetical protein
LELILLRDSGVYSAAARQNLFKTAQTSRGNGLRNLWLRWSGKEMSENYDKIREGAAFRCEVAESVGIGFGLSKSTRILDRIIPSSSGVAL